MKVLLTDHPWPDVEIERSLCAAAGHELIAGPIEAQPGEAIEAFVREHDPQAIICCWAPVTAAAIAAPHDLRVVARLGVGLDNIAIDAATARGAWVTNVPNYCVEEVSDHAIAMLLSAWRGITAFDRESKLGRWNPASARLIRTRNMTVGIVGYGGIGSLTARKLAQGFGCRVLVTSPTIVKTKTLGSEIAPGVLAATLPQIQEQCDAILLHLPLDGSNRHMIDDAFIAACRRRPFIVNVSRGGLIDNAALIRGLDAGRLSGAALDVVEGEPHPPSGVIGRSDILVTPHIAFTSDASLAELRRRCTEDVVRVLSGETPIHPCNEPHSS